MHMHAHRENDAYTHTPRAGGCGFWERWEHIQVVGLYLPIAVPSCRGWGEVPRLSLPILAPTAYIPLQDHSRLGPRIPISALPRLLT